MLAAAISVPLLLPSRVEARALLRQSAEAERAELGRVRARHKTWEMEERVSGLVLARRRVELWQGRNANPSAHRVFDENRRLVSGEWTLESAVRLSYKAGGRMQPASAPVSRESTPRGVDEAALLDLSAQTFLDIAGAECQSRMERTGSVFTIWFANASTGAGGTEPKLLRARLVLTVTGLRATEGELVVASSNRQTEYRLREINVETFIETAPPMSAFAPDSPVAETASATVLPNPDVKHLAPPAPNRSNVPLEVRVLSQLAIANITLGPLTQLQRKPDGTLELRIAARRDQRERILGDLDAVAGEPGLTITLVPLDDVPAPRLPPDDAAAPEQLSRAVAESLAPKGSAGAASDARAVALSILEDAGRLRAHSIAVREIAGRFDQKDLDSLNADQKDSWLTACLQHVLALESEAISLLKRLTSVIPESDSQSQESVPAVTQANYLSSIATVASQAEDTYKVINGTLTSRSTNHSELEIGMRKACHSLKLAVRRTDAIRGAMEPR
jgi:hypothetical protein